MDRCCCFFLDFCCSANWGLILGITLRPREGGCSPVPLAYSVPHPNVHLQTALFPSTIGFHLVGQFRPFFLHNPGLPQQDKAAVAMRPPPQHNAMQRQVDPKKNQGMSQQPQFGGLLCSLYSRSFAKPHFQKMTRLQIFGLRGRLPHNSPLCLGFFPFFSKPCIKSDTWQYTQ